jgi:phage/plasmid-associated DNA primase
MTTEEIIQRKISRSVRDLQHFFRSDPSFVLEKGDPRANIINVQERRCYCIPQGRICEMFRLMEACRMESRSLHFTERQYTDTITHSGIFLDFDRYQSSPLPQFGRGEYARFLRALGKILFDCIELPQRRGIRAIFTRKPRILEAQTKIGSVVYRDGFHVLIPEIMITKGLKMHIINEIVERKVMSRMFADIENIEPPEQMVDRASGRNPIHFMGNSKVGSPPYVIEDVLMFEIDIDEVAVNTVGIQEIPPGANLAYELSLGYAFSDPATRALVDDAGNSVGGAGNSAGGAGGNAAGNSAGNSGKGRGAGAGAASVGVLAPGIRPEAAAAAPTYTPWLRKERYECRPHMETQIQRLVETGAANAEAPREVEEAERAVDMMALTDAEARYISQLLDILDISYATEYEKWFNVLCAIASVSTRYRDVARRFSMRAPGKWNEAEFDRVWAEASSGKRHPRPVTKRSIIHWARESSPERFREISNATYTQLLRNYVFENEGRVEHAMVARLLHSMIGEKFVTDVENPDSIRHFYRWYEFVLPGQAQRKGEVFKWRREADPDQIHIFISDTLRIVYRDLLNEIKRSRDEAESEALAKYWMRVQKQFAQSMSRLSDNSFQVGVIRQAQYRFRQRGFVEDLDSYEDVLGVGNGVLRLAHRAEFIRGFHEYKVSKYTEVDYVPYDPANPYVQRLMQVFHDIFPEPDVCEFMLFHGGTWLDACEPASLLLLLVGGGQNGKSFYLRMVHSALGNQYVGAGKIALLTSPTERAESANSAQMQMKNKRGFYFEEANKCEVLNSGRVKSITSPGYQSGRDLHQRQENFRNTCNPVAASNYDFIIDTTDHGTWRRLGLYRSKVKFCRNPDPKNPFEKLEDPTIMKCYPNDDNYRRAMLSILVHYNERLRCEYNNDLRRVPCPTIDIETYQFRRRQDTVHRFITDMIVRSPESDALSLQTVALRYQEWFGKMMRGVVPSTLEIMSQFENSCLSTHLENRGNCTLFLVGHRMKSAPEDPLLPGESLLAPADAVAHADTSGGASVHADASTVGADASAHADTPPDAGAVGTAPISCEQIADVRASDNIDAEEYMLAKTADANTRDYIHTRDSRREQQLSGITDEQASGILDIAAIAIPPCVDRRDSPNALLCAHKNAQGVDVPGP